MYTQPFYRLIDESPRWLWGQGRKDEAIKIIQKALKTNNQPSVSLALDKEQRISLDNDDNEKENHNNQSFSILDLFKTPSLRKNTILICYFW